MPIRRGRRAGGARRRAALADLAHDQRWCRPVIDAGTGFLVKGGRHPVVEAALATRREAASSPTTATWETDVAACGC
jgi:hypothetical protein